MNNQLVPLSMVSNPYVVSIDYKRPAFDRMVCIKSASDVYQLMLEHLDGETLDHKEKMWLITTNRANKMLSLSLISIGGVAGVIVGINEIFQTAILTNASGIVLVHNHPSGKLAFSDSDIRLTTQVRKVAKHHNIDLLDHIVITSESYISMAEENLLS